ncbi:MAG: hypothetical protein ACOH2L_06950 [Devosia sp.]
MQIKISAQISDNTHINDLAQAVLQKCAQAALDRDYALWFFFIQSALKIDGEQPHHGAF